jgi:hypothetical protein
VRAVESGSPWVSRNGRKGLFSEIAESPHG